MIKLENIFQEGAFISAASKGFCDARDIDLPLVADYALLGTLPFLHASYTALRSVKPEMTKKVRRGETVAEAVAGLGGGVSGSATAGLIKSGIFTGMGYAAGYTIGKIA